MVQGWEVLAGRHPQNGSRTLLMLVRETWIVYMIGLHTLAFM